MRGKAEELFSLLRAGYFTRLIEFASVDGKTPATGSASPCTILAKTVAEALLSQAFYGVICRY
jgi:hypothetical protein